MGQDPKTVVIIILLLTKFHFLLTDETGTPFGDIVQNWLTCSSIIQIHR